jgi:hypothetical protein
MSITLYSVAASLAKSCPKLAELCLTHGLNRIFGTSRPPGFPLSESMALTARPPGGDPPATDTTQPPLKCERCRESIRPADHFQVLTAREKETGAISGKVVHERCWTAWAEANEIE